MNRELFQNPLTSCDHTLSPFWFWNDSISEDRITEQLEIMKQIGVMQPVIHARHGLKVPYLSAEWFQCIRRAVEEARHRQMKIWLYDENNWPSGNCNSTVTIDEENREHFLLISAHSMEAGETLSMPADCIAATAYDVDNVRTDLSLSPTYTAAKKITLYLVQVKVNDYEPLGKLAVDYLSKKALGLFIKKTHDEYAKHFFDDFGDTIAGIFMDETRFLNALPWTAVFPEEFLKRKGYDILPLLHLLLKKGPESYTVRYDYFDVVSDLLAEATFKQIYDWCEVHGIRSIGHVLGEETLASQARFNGDITRIYRYLHIPSIDHLGNGLGSLDAKICSSSAHNYGKLVVGSESFGASGWDMTYEELVKISNWLYQQGINHVVVHAFYYSIRGERQNDWPPSYFYQWHDWGYMKPYAEMAARMSAVLQGAVNDSHLLVYYPVESFWAHFDPDFQTQTCYYKEGPEIRDEKARKIDHDFQYLCSELLNRNLDFELLGADAADCFQVRKGKLVNIHTGAWYNQIVLPYVELLPAAVADLLNRFQAGGGRIIQYPEMTVKVVGKHGEHQHSPALLPCFCESGCLAADTMQEAADLCETNATRPFRVLKGCSSLMRTNMAYPGRLHDPYLHDGEQLYGVGITTYIKEGERILNFTNYNETEELLLVEAELSGVPALYNPESGRVLTLEADRTAPGIYRFSLRLPPNRVLFVIGDI